MSASSYESDSSSDDEPRHPRLKSSVSVKRPERDRAPRTPSVSSDEERRRAPPRRRHYSSEEDGEITPAMSEQESSDEEETEKREWRKEERDSGRKTRREDRDISDSDEDAEQREQRKRNKKKRRHRDSEERYSRRKDDSYERDLQEEIRRQELEKRRMRREVRHREQSEERRIEREKRHKQREEDEKKRRKEESERPERKRKRDDDNDGGGGDGENEDDVKKFLAEKRAKQETNIMTKTGGAYIPPARLRMMQANITDKKSEQFQRIAWEALKKSINGLINKVNISNIVNIVRELFQENIVRGRGVLARSIIQAQAASPTFTHVYAAFVAIINTKFPQNGELMLKRLILNFKKSFRRNDKPMCLSSSKFIAHLVNQQVAHEIVALEMLTLLLENPTNDSVEVAVGFLKDCGAKLTEVSPRGAHAIFERMRNVLHEAAVDTRTQYMIEVMFAVRKDGFKDHPSVMPELDLVEEDDQFTHMLTLDDAVNAQDILNVYKFDPEYEESEEKYKVLKREILGEGSSDSEDGSDSGSGSSGSESDSESGEEGENEEAKQLIIDKTETNMIAFRRTVYLTIQSSLDFEECCHKLLKTNIPPGMESELTNMILDCCAQQRTYEKFFGLLAQRFCMINKIYVDPFQLMFKEQYETSHRLETNKLRNVAKFFGHLLHSDAISWEVLQWIHLNEDETTSSSRIFIKILFQELSEYMGLPKLNARLNDETLVPYFEGLFPRDNPRNTRFAINFFTSIGLGSLTVELRNHLKTMPKPKPAVAQMAEDDSSDSSESSSDSSDSSDSSSDSDSSSSSSSSDEEQSRKSKKKQKDKKPKQEIANGHKNGRDSNKKKRRNSYEIDSREESREVDKRQRYSEKERKGRRNKENERYENNIDVREKPRSKHRQEKDFDRYEESRSKRDSERDNKREHKHKKRDKHVDEDDNRGSRHRSRHDDEDNHVTRYSNHRDSEDDERSHKKHKHEKHKKQRGRERGEGEIRGEHYEVDYEDDRRERRKHRNRDR